MSSEPDGLFIFGLAQKRSKKPKAVNKFLKFSFVHLINPNSPESLRSRDQTVDLILMIIALNFFPIAIGTELIQCRIKSERLNRSH